MNGLSLLLEAASTGLALTVFAYAAVEDWRRREVSDRLWLAAAPAGVGLTLARGILEGLDFQAWLAGLAVAAAVAFALAYVGFWGGADCKALIFLALTLPFMPSFARPVLGLWMCFLPFTVLFNTYLLSLAVVAHNLARNLACRLRGERLFEGFEAEPLHVKAFALLVAYRVERGRAAGSPAVSLAETFGDGRRFRFKLGYEEPDGLNVENLPERVWVTPQLPLLVFMAGGLVAALLLGDLVLWVIAQAMLALTV